MNEPILNGIIAAVAPLLNSKLYNRRAFLCKKIPDLT